MIGRYSAARKATGVITRWYLRPLPARPLDFGAMPTFRAPRGTHDLLPPERVGLARLERLGAELAARYGYQPIETPIFEQTAVFERGIGEVTDVVEKELFRIVARSEDAEAWALRPEPTAGIVRAYVQHGMQTWPQPVKLTMTGPMFRYDRPQAGRYRQFWQFDVEAIGDAGPGIDAEIIELASRFFRDAGLPGIDLLLNSIGDPSCRPAYVARLADYYRSHADRLPPVERARLERNPLRLLDSKEPAMAELNAAAPAITDHLCAACAEHFAGVRRHLDAVGVEYRLEPRLVRGLDYYTRTAFEVYPRGASGQQSALGGGGRYDGLVELLGGKPTPGIGFGLGLDRTLLALDAAGVAETAEGRPLAVVVGADPGATAERLRIATELRANGLAARADLATRKLGRQLEAASKEGAHFAVILGDELVDGQVQLRDLQAGTQQVLPVGDLVKHLTRAGDSHRHG
jgi:histidyl-tRNA synthetase